jgi:hypothetical protein
LSRPYSRKGTRSFGEELGPKPKKRALENVCTKLQKAEKLQKNPGTTVGVSSNIRRPKTKRKSIPGLRNNWREKIFLHRGEKRQEQSREKSFCYEK